MAPTQSQPSPDEPQPSPQSQPPHTTYSTIPLIGLMPLFGHGEFIANAVMEFLQSSATVLLNLITTVFSDLLASFIFLAPPSQIGGLNMLWQKSMFLFFAIWTLLTISMLGFRQIFPYSPKFNLYEYAVRSGSAFLLLIIGRPMLNLAFRATNALGMYIWPQEYTLAFAGHGVEGFLGAATGMVLGYTLGLLILYQGSAIAFLLLFAMLSVRAILLYTIYAFFPLFLAMYMLDLGPLKHSRQLAELVFKAFGLLLAMGIFVAAIMATGAAIAGFDPGTDYTDASIEGPDNTGSSSDCQEHTGDSDYPDHCAKTGFAIRLMGFYGAILGSIAILSSALAMLVSTAGGTNPTGGGGNNDNDDFDPDDEDTNEESESDSHSNSDSHGGGNGGGNSSGDGGGNGRDDGGDGGHDGE